MNRSIALALALLFAFAACTSEGANLSGAASNGSAATHGPRPTCGARATTPFEGRRMAVRLRITPCRVTRGEAPKAVLINTGAGELGYGFAFVLERRTDQGWRWINKKQGFLLPLFYLAPGARSDPESLAVYLGKQEPIELRPGLYRVTKSVDLAPGEPRPPTMEVRATFRVV